jgi:hypothetical protein
MSSKLRFVSVLPLAFWTLQRFIVYVFVNMADKVAFINKCFATNLAFPFVLIGI